LKGEAAGAVSEERPDQPDQVRGDSLLSKEGEESGRFHVMKAHFNIAEKGGDFVSEAVEGFDIVL